MTWPVVTMGVPAWSHLLHLKPITFFPHFIRRLCHSWHFIQRRRRPVGKPVRQKSPLGRLIYLVLFYIDINASLYLFAPHLLLFHLLPHSSLFLLPFPVLSTPPSPPHPPSTPSPS